MSFEKKMKKRGNQKLDAFAKNPYHQETPKVVESKPKPFPTWAKVMIPTFAVATCLVVFMVPIIMMGGAKNTAMKPNGGEAAAPTNDGDSRYQGSSTDKATPGNNSYYEEGSQAAYVPTWSEATIIQKYPEFVYQGNKYQIRYSDRSQPIDAKYIDTKLADLTVSGYDMYERVNHETNAEIYSIKNIATDASLAIKFSDDTNYYAYQNVSCSFPTLGDLVNKVSFETEVNFTLANYAHFDASENYVEDKYTNISKSEIMNILFNDLTIANTKAKPKLNAPNDSSSGGTSYVPQSSNGEHSEQRAESAVTITTAIPCLGIDNAYIRMWQGGKLDVNLFGSLSIFPIGEAKYQSLVTYLTSLN